MKKYYEITATESGFDGNLAFEYIFAKIQDAITVAFGEIGCDNITLRNKYHSMWVFSKQKAKIYRRPVWNETVMVNTRIVKANKLICYVKTEIFDENNTCLIEGITECCVLDIESFKFVRLANIPFHMEEEECDTSFNFSKQEMGEIYDAKVSLSLIDMSNHLNNAKALLLLADILGIDKVKEIQAKPFEIGIRYINQAMYNTNIKISLTSIENGYTFSYFNDKVLEEGYIKTI